MPAHRLTDRPMSIRKYDVAGRDSTSAQDFVRHVGLSAEEHAELRAADEIPLVHMQPPLDRSGRPIPVHSFGTAGLTYEEIRQVGVFVDELASEYEARKVRAAARQFIVSPHVNDKTGPDGTVIFRQFSCAGFVIEAYREAAIDLLSTAPAALPSVSLETLERAYPEQARELESPMVRERVGLRGDGPWPVVLPGYVLNALARSESEIRAARYTSLAGDEFFPPQRSNA